jgi:hypothetical protein
MLRVYSGYAPRQAEIADLDGAVFIDEHIGWLQVSVNNIAAVEVLDRAQQMINHSLDVLYLKMDGALDDLLQI